MPDAAAGLHLSEPETALIGKLNATQNLFLTAVATIAFLNIVGRLVPWVAEISRGGWRPMSVEAAVATLVSSASLLLLHQRFAAQVHAAAMALAALLTAWSAAVLIAGLAPAAFAFVPRWLAMGMTPQVADCFVLLGMAILLVTARRRMAVLAGDFITFCLLFAVAVEASGHMIASVRFFGPVATFRTSAQTLFCLVLLAWVVFVRKAERGMFSILLGRGIGSKVARLLAPLLVVIPYLREAMRAHLFLTPRMPPHYVTALLATAAVAVSMTLLMYLAWRLNALESEIQGLSLRDALTGLYNLRGFRFLAEQSLRMARRSQEPFSVLFIDVDNLKQINDGMGHQAGSDFLSATAEILRGAFRETDVLGRIGGDEFAVAGQFNDDGIAKAALRLRQAAARHSVECSPAIALSFSIGFVTSSPGQREPLAELLARADQEMYREKRRRKAAASREKSKPPKETEQTLFPSRATSEPGKLRETEQN